MKEFVHTPPSGENPPRRLALQIEGKEVGHALLHHYLQPFPFYRITFLGVKKEYQNQKYSSDLMTEIEKLLKQEDVAGILGDGIDEDNPAKGMWDRRSGWDPIPGRNAFYIFNTPQGVVLDSLEEVLP